MNEYLHVCTIQHFYSLNYIYLHGTVEIQGFSCIEYCVVVKRVAIVEDSVHEGHMGCTLLMINSRDVQILKGSYIKNHGIWCLRPL